MKKPSTGRLTEAQIREGLIELGLKEEEKPIDGYGFTYRKEPRAALRTYYDVKSDTVPTRFYIGTSSYVLSA